MCLRRWQDVVILGEAMNLPETQRGGCFVVCMYAGVLHCSVV